MTKPQTSTTTVTLMDYEARLTASTPYSPPKKKEAKKEMDSNGTSTTSEKSKCEHGEMKAHEWIKYIPVHGPTKIYCNGPEPTCEHDNTGAHWNRAARNGREVDYCNGPVIATPEKCLDCGHQTPHADELVYCEIAGCNCDRTSVSTEAQTPDLASANTAAEYLAEYRSDPENEREFQAALKRDSAQATVPEATVTDKKSNG